MHIPKTCPPQSLSPTPRDRLDADTLARANINPVTGLATDYLNHFSEVIMLLEMLSTMPDCVEDILAWRPVSYHDHFAGSRLKDRELAIAAYANADEAARQRLDELTEAMNAILQATRDALMLQLSPEAAGTLAQQAAGWLKPLVGRAGAVINGDGVRPVEETAEDVPQTAVDALFQH
jgi:hypothetical protein